jgi:putative endonuclease
MKKFSSKTQKVGQIGEEIACRHLMRKGFVIVERNYTRKCGEIDIIARMMGVFHFVEVKSVSCENFKRIESYDDMHRPEDQIHAWKRACFKKTIETYLASNSPKEWKIDAICLYLDQKKRKAKLKMMEDIVL